MAYASLEQCLIDLEKNGQLIRIKETVDPYLEMAAIHLRVYQSKGPAFVYSNFKDIGGIRSLIQYLEYNGYKYVYKCNCMTLRCYFSLLLFCVFYNTYSN